MASISHSPVSFTGTSASDLLRSSSNGVSGIPLKSQGRVQLYTRRRNFGVTAALRKVKKHEYPWPEDPDPNVEGGILAHLSHFKPLKEKPKPVTLDFEKPLVQLEKKIIDVRKMANETGLDFSDQIISLENKYHQALKDLYTHLTPIQRVNIARHPNRPTFLDHVFNITDKFVELHGDRAGYDDPAIVTGLGTIGDRRMMFIGHQKGRNTKENIQRNFGMPTPHGYRKALRMMYYADHHGFPIVTFIDTPGAFADLKSEELGQGEAIAHNLRTMFGLKVPIVSIVIGEGGSGGALAIGCANKLLMLENAVFYVASPEACAAILWKTAKASPKAAEKLKITATELCKLQIADGIIPEPLGGAHADPSWTSQQIKAAINESMDELEALMEKNPEEILRHRMLKFRKIGGFQEGTPIDPKRKFNMKRKEGPIQAKTSELNLKDDIEKLRQQILKAKESSTGPSELALNEMIEKLKKEIDLEFSEAAKAMGVKDRIEKLRQEFSKANSQDQLMHPGLMDTIEKLKAEFNQGLSSAPNYSSLKYKLDMLNELSKTKGLSENKKKAATLKQEINNKFKEVMDRPDIKEKMEALTAEVQRCGVSKFDDLDQGSKDTILKMKKEIELEAVNILKSMGLEIEVVEKAREFSERTTFPEFKARLENLNEEVNKKIEDVVNSSDLKNMIGVLKLEIAKAGKTPNTESRRKIEALEQQIKQRLSEALSSSELKEKHEELEAEISEALKSSGGLDGSLKAKNPMEDNSKHDEPRVEVNLGANCS
ncbi:acetyl-coenzyme A carboxylase carboxyl transferase [Tripterygium wilfordii]|uniref:acetyl-CoA carboxytransferase n=1 Tax=Tripterygium wilfordii TaxID=458696 RepID=A0A7J7CTA3_TRIWF|nr:acetyl-coenzyme A carboxylase carboxyl transferase subunit alpha, chloroplastic [Tripterygium wilfordii]XP_038720170.1 acetyl-coenzyme A carboxylase carboxyl transferase subunit alpha, chloroplastic [Tripterygium wilfordii]XP_038720171.1 acetyl-coenzyme A carboxylase carboxyl transferase subunit alpha, chloroplastic [Tripterygium wilfordii]KAF5737218.1 acetyl-coenzyme A carboxylase carboxyl transferase [Tripterygium wilfordii]